MVKKVMRKFRDIQEEYQVIDTKNATTKNTVQHRMLKLSIYTFVKTLKKEKKIAQSLMTNFSNFV